MPSKPDSFPRYLCFLRLMEHVMRSLGWSLAIYSMPDTAGSPWAGTQEDPDFLLGVATD